MFVLPTSYKDLKTHLYKSWLAYQSITNPWDKTVCFSGTYNLKPVLACLPLFNQVFHSSGSSRLIDGCTPPCSDFFYFNFFFFPDLSGNQVAWNPVNLWTPFLKATIQLVLDGKVSESLLYFFFFFLPHCWMLSLSGITPINKSKHNLMLHLSNQLVSASYGNYSITFKSSRLNKWVLVTSHLESFFFFLVKWNYIKIYKRKTQ